MPINVHPLLVHFPIALLIVYSILELVSIEKIRKLSFWIYVKSTLLFIGIFFIIPTLVSGIVIQDQFSTLSVLVRIHSLFGAFSAFLYGILSLVYAYSMVGKSWPKLVVNQNLISILAVIGLAALTVTGALGGTIVYGPNMDIFTSFIYHIFFPNP